MGKGKGRNKGTDKVTEVTKDTDLLVTEVLTEVDGFGDVDPMDTPEDYLAGPLDLPEMAPELSPETEARIRTRMDLLRTELDHLTGVLASYQVHHLVTSTMDSPVSLARKYVLSTLDKDGKLGKRSNVVRVLVGKGMAPNTAKTQYQVTKKALEKGEKWVTDLLSTLTEEIK